jgi:hypothetical protein
MLKNILVKEQNILSGGKHVKFIIYDDKFRFKKMSAILWHKAADYSGDFVDKKIDILFTFGKESRGFVQKFYLSIVDFKLST